MKHFDDYNLDNKSTIDRLLKDNWYVFCNTKKEMQLLLMVCNKAGLKWNSGEEPFKYRPDEPPPAYIAYGKEEAALFYYTKSDMRFWWDAGYMLDIENLTDWFFHSIQK